MPGTVTGEPIMPLGPPAERAQQMERRIREKGPVHMKSIMSAESHFALGTNRGELPMADRHCGGYSRKRRMTLSRSREMLLSPPFTSRLPQKVMEPVANSLPPFSSS